MVQTNPKLQRVLQALILQANPRPSVTRQTEYSKSTSPLSRQTCKLLHFRKPREDDGCQEQYDLDAVEHGLQFVIAHMHKLLWALVRRSKAQQVQRCQTCLTSATCAQG